MSPSFNSSDARCLNNEPINLPPLISLLSFKFDLDGFVLLSLLFQFCLAVVAPWRKHSLANLHRFIAVVYVEAISFATYAMELVPDGSVQGGRTNNVRVFWAPFLILHLGGPNTIAGLSMLDNELWLRYASHLFTLSYAFGRVFLHNYFLKNQLWLPTLFVFFAGVIKYAEKVICLFSSRLTKFRDSSLLKPDPGENYAKLMQTHASFQISKSTTTAVVIPDPDSIKYKLRQVQIVKQAYRFFQDFQGLFVNSVYRYDQRETSRQYFLRRDAEDAFDICEVELNFAYDVFYTKAILIQKTKLPIVNFVTILLQLASLVLWWRVDECPFHRSSLYLTRTLVYGSIALDLLSILMFFTSDWAVAMLKQKNKGAESVFSPHLFYERMLLFKKSMRGHMWRGLWFRRWSESIPQLDLLSSCDDKHMGNIVRMCSGLKGKVPRVRFSGELREFLFKELENRSRSAQHPKDVERLCFARGMWILTRLSLRYEGLRSILAPWVADVEYEESLILWHIATTLCYKLEKREARNTNQFCGLSKILSNYMLRRVIRQPMLMIPPSSGLLGRMISLDTCAEAKHFFDRVLPPRPWHQFMNNNIKKRRLRRACNKLIAVNTDVVPPREVRGDESKSVLFDACALAKKLRSLEQDRKIDKWEIISKVWAEMLFYCAGHSPPSIHVRNLESGGDLLTIVWLLMANLGLGNHFRYNKARDTAAVCTSFARLN